MIDFEHVSPPKYTICLRVSTINYATRVFVYAKNNQFVETGKGHSPVDVMEFETAESAEKYFNIVKSLAEGILRTMFIPEAAMNLTTAHRGATLSLVKTRITTTVESEFKIPELGYDNYLHTQSDQQQ